MVNTPNVLAIVQARGGSKAIPRKNLSLLGGVPLIAYSLASAQAATTITRVIVSTDDEEIADVARSFGAEVPFMRPASLATDDATDFPLFDHAVAWLAAHENYHPDVIVQLRPTTPLRPRGLLDDAVRELIDDPQADCVRGVTRANEDPHKMWRMDCSGYLEPLLTSDLSEPYNTPRQRLPVTYWQTGHVDAIRRTTITELRSLTGRIVRSVVIDSKYCIDIDTVRDLDLANWTLQHDHLEIDVPTLRNDHFSKDRA